MSRGQSSATRVCVVLCGCTLLLVQKRPSVLLHVCPFERAIDAPEQLLSVIVATSLMGKKADRNMTLTMPRIHRADRRHGELLKLTSCPL